MIRSVGDSDGIGESKGRFLVLRYSGNDYLLVRLKSPVTLHSARLSRRTNEYHKGTIQLVAMVDLTATAIKDATTDLLSESSKVR